MNNCPAIGVKCLIGAALCLIVWESSGFGQTAEQPVLLVIETENAVAYRGDTNDVSLIARDPKVTTPGPSRAFSCSLPLNSIACKNLQPSVCHKICGPRPSYMACFAAKESGPP